MIPVGGGDVSPIAGFSALALAHTIQTLPEEFPGIAAIPEDVTYLLGCRKFRQFCGTFRSLADPKEFCLFCNLKLVDKKPTFEAGGWFAKENDFPYANHRHHYVLFPKRHLTNTNGLTVQDAIDRFTLETQLREMHQVDGYASVMRAGNPRHTGATVPHTHAHWQVPEGEGLAVAYFAKDVKHLVEDYKRMQWHMQLIRINGGLGWLMNPNTVIVEPT